jgi:hypothetical protein
MEGDIGVGGGAEGTVGVAAGPADVSSVSGSERSSSSQESATFALDLVGLVVVAAAEESIEIFGGGADMVNVEGVMNEMNSGENKGVRMS